MITRLKPGRPRRWILSFLSVPVLYLILLIPGPGSNPPLPAGRKAFVWNQDQYWSALESRYVAARGTEKKYLIENIETGLRQSAILTSSLNKKQYLADDTLFDEIERNIFVLAPLVASCPEYLDKYVISIVRLRSAVKNQSRGWDMDALPVRDRMYRLLYGSRAATEEVLLQTPHSAMPATVLCDDERSATPAMKILGVTVHSGDILVSRGGAATSALIARGNDYPGNFSHVALIRVDSSGQAQIIEAHIEKGVVIASLDDYLRDTKLRVMVLRLRSDLPALSVDPMLPEKAAFLALQRAQTRHIPYDFSMDFRDTSKFFCSEVVSDAYSRFGIKLWMRLSSISNPGVASWLADFGVKHFETEEPSDLEYDPQLRVVAEWRDPEVLFKDHIDNAVIDAMLEGAERGEGLDYDWYMLPIARIARAYSVVLNLLGKAGPVPEGMSAAAALRNKKFTAHHADLAVRVLEGAREFQRTKGYLPPYWELLKLAREAKAPMHF